MRFTVAFSARPQLFAFSVAAFCLTKAMSWGWSSSWWSSWSARSRSPTTRGLWWWQDSTYSQESTPAVPWIDNEGTPWLEVPGSAGRCWRRWQDPAQLPTRELSLGQPQRVRARDLASERSVFVIRKNNCFLVRIS